MFRDIRESVEALVRPNQLFADAVDVRQVSTGSEALSLDSFGSLATFSYFCIIVCAESLTLLDRNCFPVH